MSRRNRKGPVVHIDMVNEVAEFIEPFKPETKICIREGENLRRVTMIYCIEEDGKGYIEIQ